jgi:Ni,Fe-hydrogenase I large subunit
MTLWLDQLDANIANGEVTIHNGVNWEPSSWPRDAEGWGTTEAPRGSCGHWIRICDGKISRYQIVVPSTWNGSPRDSNGVRGPWEHALLGLPVADPDRPLEVLRTLHSFDPCMACAVHVIGARKASLTLPPAMVGRVLHRG